jgi:hypothetical protein
VIEPINISAIGWSEFKKSYPLGRYLTLSEINLSKSFQLVTIYKDLDIIDGFNIEIEWEVYVQGDYTVYLIKEKYTTREEFIDLLRKFYPEYLEYFFFQEEFING